MKETLAVHHCTSTFFTLRTREQSRTCWKERFALPTAPTMFDISSDLLEQF